MSLHTLPLASHAKLPATEHNQIVCRRIPFPQHSLEDSCCKQNHIPWSTEMGLPVGWNSDSELLLPGSLVSEESVRTLVRVEGQGVKECE